MYCSLRHLFRCSHLLWLTHVVLGHLEWSPIRSFWACPLLLGLLMSLGLKVYLGLMLYLLESHHLILVFISIHLGPHLLFLILMLIGVGALIQDVLPRVTVFLGDNLVSWFSKSQYTLSWSSVEAEYRVLLMWSLSCVGFTICYWNCIVRLPRLLFYIMTILVQSICRITFCNINVLNIYILRCTYILYGKRLHMVRFELFLCLHDIISQTSL